MDTKTLTFQANKVELILDDAIINEMAAEAAISLNKNITWMKLVLTDDLFNANRQRIPREEFANVIRTGVYMPVKMSPETISENHAGAEPLGTMAHLKTNGNTIEALAALWPDERPKDIAYLKEKYKDGKHIDFSWEITYTGAIEEDGGEALTGVSMNAATVVGMPAYQGRTQTISMSSDKKTDGENIMEDTMKLEDHNKALAELKENYEAQLKELQDKLEAQAEELKELSELREYKAEIEEAKEKIAKLQNIQQKFEEAGLKVDEDYFKEREEILLAMSSDQLDFLVQEMAASLTKAKEAQDNADDDDADAEASVQLTSKNVPNLGTTDSGEITQEDIVKYLREQDK
jgi:chemotaxis protein CheY-P-specific phosphatase CheC